MKLLRLKITDPDGFRSLPCGFEHHFRTEWSLQDELAQPEENFAPFVCAGPNGSGKSNLLEALAAIFYQLELQRVRRSFLPAAFENDSVDGPDGLPGTDGSPSAYELEYLIRIPMSYPSPATPVHAHVQILKDRYQSPSVAWLNFEEFGEVEDDITASRLTAEERDFLVPQYVLGYSSGENEILSLPFFKVRFIQFDEYWNALSKQLPYPGKPETRLAFLDNGFSQAILLCNLLFESAETLAPFREEVGITALTEFRIILRRSIPLSPEQLTAFASEDQSEHQSLDDIVQSNRALRADVDEQGETQYRINLLQLLEGDERSSLMVSALKRCATLNYVDEATDTLILDYWVNDATKQAFRENFDGSPLALFQALQVLLTLNLYTVSDALKADLYQSPSHYVSETVPTLASDERVMRFKNFYFTKRGVKQPMLLKELSDGEHQLLHSLGLCLLFRDTNSLFLLDEPETHFNPAWRASFITRLRSCLQSEERSGQEMLITTHSPFLISDSRPDKVLVFDKNADTGAVSISHPDYNTFGASINKITMTTFGKRETIGGQAQKSLEKLRARLELGEDVATLMDELDRELGDSVEKVLFAKTMLDRMNKARAEKAD